MIAAHAMGLGCDGLILWLATLIHDQKFVGREAGKTTNFSGLLPAAARGSDP